jgi:hypothetical protein
MNTIEDCCLTYCNDKNSNWGCGHINILETIGMTCETLIGEGCG